MKAQRRAAPRCRARRAPLCARRRAPLRRKNSGRKGPIIPLTSRGGKPPSYFELLQEAVLTLKDANAGASLPQIRRQLQRRYKGRFDQAGDKMLTTALQRLADRGKVIYKRGYRYQFNAPKVSKPTASSSPSDQSSYSGGTSRSKAMSGSSAPSTNATSRTSGSYSDSATSGTRPREAAKDGAQAAPKDASEGKSSSGDDASSTAPESASSTASRGASSSKKR